jgi:polar amino acid transport system substrate-binding protein
MPRVLLLALLVALLAVPAAGRAEGEPVAFEAAQRVVVGMDPAYPPYEFLDASGQPAGFNVDLTRAIAEVMGMQVELRSGRWSEMRAALTHGQIDVLQGLTFSEERARDLEFAAPHAIVHHAIFARRDGPRPSTIEELRGRKVIVFGGGIMDETLAAHGYGPDLVRVGTPADALRLLASGQHDAVALAALPGAHIVRELGLTNVVQVGRPIATQRYGFAVKKGNGLLLARFEEGLAILKRTGRYDVIHDRWLGVLEPREPPWGAILRWSALVLVPLLAILAATVLWSRSLQRQVAQRTASLAREVEERERVLEELRVHQQQLVHADKMAALGVLVAGVAHEVNNPNGYILLNLPILKAAFDDAAEALDARASTEGDLRVAGLPWSRMRVEIPQMLDEMAAGGRRIKHIVQDLKDFARREDRAPVHGPVDVNDVARSAVRLLDHAIRKATRRFELDLPAGLPPVKGDAGRIEQVVVNLLLNACQALPGSDRAVRLATSHDAARGEVVIEVIDEGVGIAQAQIARLTEPFFTTRRESGGTGLGLSVSAGIVKEHGGTLEFRSTVGQGTTARLTLPAVRKEAAA